MKELKDNFSAQAPTYASYRPTYPDTLYNFLFDHTSSFVNAWDCGTGNGQVANMLATRFKNIYATDISEQQLAHAAPQPNIVYKKERAETTSFAPDFFDLITIGQAIHWFDFDAFYKEVYRVAKNNALVAAWTYSLVKIEEQIDMLINDYYVNTTGPYWDKERKLVDEEYKTIPFPFREIAVPPFTITLHWQLEQFIGYLYSWSAAQHYMRQKQQDPVKLLLPSLQELWRDGEVKEVHFPVFMRAGYVEK